MATVALPSNVEAERAVLGCMLCETSAASIGIDSLVEDDFSDEDPRNKVIFHAMRELHDAHKPIEIQGLIDQMITAKTSDAAGGTPYLRDLLDSVIDPGSIDQYVFMVKEQSVLRQLLLKCQSIQREYAQGVSNISDFILSSNDAITQIAQKRSVQGMKSAAEVARIVQDQIELKSRADSGHRGLTGLATGYRLLDDYTHGWQKGDLIILAARPSVGKTAFGMNLAFQAAARNKCSVGFFSLEMSADRIMERLIASRSSVSNDSISTGALSARDRAKVGAALQEIAATQMYFDDTPNSKLGDLVAKATKLKSNHPDLGLIVIDYLGRIRYADKVDMANHQVEVSMISGALKSMARELNVPVLCLTQLNRNVEQNDDKRPTLANLRDSGSIEQDADIVMLMYRPDYYTANGGTIKSRGQRRGASDEEQEEAPAAPSEEERKANGDASETEIIIAKNRNGKTGTITLMFQKAYSLFCDHSTDYEERQAAIQSASYDDIGMPE